MFEITDPSAEGVEQLKLESFTENAYLEYSMYVILDRALPHIGDGLKPVQRRIVYAMSELGLKSTAKYKKSARTVGDVLGKFHPHGDSACYDAMVLMAQPFSYRYPLVDGQGNWGSQDNPKSYAAMRYTEAKLHSYSELLLAELGQGTTEWAPNFDGTMVEPRVLPARVPNVLLNGTTGIAVGMATDIPPHNLKEVISAVNMLLEHPDADLDAIYPMVPAPDFPTDAEIITSESDLKRMYRSGNGSIRMRAVYINENGDIIITALPHQVSGEKVIEQIAAQMQAKKLPMVADLRDESDHENPTRIVITPRSNRVDREALMMHLFATTDLERNYRVNMNVIGLDGRPKVRGLVALLNEWIVYRKQTITKRLEFRLGKVQDRLHILDGLLLAFLNIDEVIDVIRSEDEPKQVLMARFGLSEKQSEAILDLKLRHLAKLEEMKIRAEQNDLSEERDRIEKILGSEKELVKLMKSELKEDAEKFGDLRRSPLVSRDEAQAMDPNAMTPAEPVTVILSEKGWIRAAKGHEVDPEKLNYKSGDSFFKAVHCKSNQLVILLDSTGRSYSIPAHNLPSARGQGEPVTGRLQMPSGAGIIDMLSGQPEDKLLITSDAGYGFIVQLQEFYTKNKTGKAVLTVPAGANPISPIPVKNLNEQLIVAVTNEARMLVFPVSAMPELVKGKGNQVIGIPSAKVKNRVDFMSSIILLSPGDQLLVHAGKRYLNFKYTELEEYKNERGRRGQKLPRGFQKVDLLEVVKPEEPIEPEIEQKELF